MVTFAQALERGTEWVNGDVPEHLRREVRVREFGSGFVIWAEDRPDGPRSEGGAQRLVVARDSGEATLWPSLPVGEVIRRYEEEYGPSDPPPRPDAVVPERLDLNQTSFLLSPPEWLQEAADKLGLGDRGGEAGAAGPDGGAPEAPPGPPSPVPEAGKRDVEVADDTPADAPAASTPRLGGDEAGAGPAPARPSELAPDRPDPDRDREEPGATPWAGTDTNAEEGEDRSVPLPETVFASPPADEDDEGRPHGSAPGPPGVPAPPASAGRAPASGTASDPDRPAGGDGPLSSTPDEGGRVPSPACPPASPPVPSLDDEPHPATPAPAPPGPPEPGDPGPPAPPGPPRSPRRSGPPAAPGGPLPDDRAPAGLHEADTMITPSVRPPGVPPSRPGPPPMPAAPPPVAPDTPPAPGAGGGGHRAVPHAETTLAAPRPGAHAGRQPLPEAAPAQDGPRGLPGPGAPAHGAPPPSPPTVGPGYQAVLRYRGPDGAEHQIIRRSAPGAPHPEWQIYHELRAANVPPDQVLELHTELRSCDLPGAYCSRMIREQWPQARITSIAPYGTDHAGRREGVRRLLAHQDELREVAAGPSRPAPVRAPLPPVRPVAPVPPEVVGRELTAAYGSGVFRCEPAAVARQGVPEVVARTLTAAGLPMDAGPFFWALARPGRPVPTLAELAAEQGLRPVADAASYLVVGSDFGRAVCVQYGTAAIVAVPVESAPAGVPAPPRFVNTGIVEFARCLALLGGMWPLRRGLNQEQAGRWTVDFQARLASLDPAALGSPESWWSVLLEQMWDGLL
ncbi:SUKH-4 family immunity protein [Streptomyces sp. WMMC905]|uniref:SUKH-4 family immunity protein n=1 Tax=Streptomyces sp. WMMC905 TaxID=3404123 RepID=UPI003B95C03C